jgi:transcriptional regulator with XRE-family HTH domain
VTWRPPAAGDDLALITPVDHSAPETALARRVIHAVHRATLDGAFACTVISPGYGPGHVAPTGKRRVSRWYSANGTLVGMAIDRRRPVDLGASRASELRRWVGRDLRVMRVAGGSPQRRVAMRSGISQPFLSLVERGGGGASVEVLSTLAEAVGGRLSMKIIPGDGISLRDSGQLELVQLIAGLCHPRWQQSIERPIAEPPDRRAADLVLELPEEVNMVEIERWWVDHQAQLRGLQLKRAALSERLGRPVNLVVCVLDTRRNRSVLHGFDRALEQSFRVGARAVWRAMQAGTPIGGDAFVWIRPHALRTFADNRR